MSTGPRNCPNGKPVWCTPVAKPRRSRGHHSATMATLTGSMAPVPTPMTTRQIARPVTVRVKAVMIDDTQVTATATTQVQARRWPRPTTSASAPISTAPTNVPANDSETSNPPSVASSPNSFEMSGSSVGRMMRSIDVMRMASVVMISIHHDTGCARGRCHASSRRAAEVSSVDIVVARLSL